MGVWRLAFGGWAFGVSCSSSKMTVTEQTWSGVALQLTRKNQPRTPFSSTSTKTGSLHVNHVFLAREMIRANVPVAVKAETEPFVDSAKLPAVSLAVQTKV